MTERNDKQISRRDMLKLLGSSAAGMSMAKVAGLSGAATALLQGMPAGAQSKVEIWTGFGQGRMADAMQARLIISPLRIPNSRPSTSSCLGARFMIG